MRISKNKLRTLRAISRGARPARLEPAVLALWRAGLVVYDWERPVITDAGLAALSAARAA